MTTSLCGAKTRGGTPCRLPPVPGKTRCRLHGGLTPSGIASPHFKTGRYSKDLPTRLIARYQEAVSDPELLNLREDIALLDARLSDLLARVESGETGERWRQAQSYYREMDKAIRKGDAEGLSEAMGRLGSAIVKGTDDYGAWDEIGTLLDQRRRLVESERKRLVEMQLVMDVRQAMVFVAAVLDTVKRHVTDRQQLAFIGNDLQRLLATEETRAVRIRDPIE